MVLPFFIVVSAINRKARKGFVNTIELRREMDRVHNGIVAETSDERTGQWVVAKLGIKI